VRRLEPTTQVGILLAGGAIWLALIGLWIAPPTETWIRNMPMPLRTGVVPLSLVYVHVVPIALAWLGFRFLLRERAYARKHLALCAFTLVLVAFVIVIYLVVVVF
jgi:hypothetical protein